MIRRHQDQGSRSTVCGPWNSKWRTLREMGWRMEAGEFGTVRDLAIAVNLAERHVSRQLRLAYLAPEVLKRLVFGREVSAVTVMQLSECARLPWLDQAGVVFGAPN